MQILRPDAVWTPEGLRDDVAVTIDSGTIIRVGAPDGQPGGDEVRLPGRILLPGLVNAHSHAFQRAFRGHVQWRARADDDFWSWRERMYAVANRLDPEGVEAVSALAFLEMIEAGITHVGEFHYLHHQPDGRPYADPDELARRVVAAATAVGLRITLLRVAYLRGGPGVPLRPEQIRFGDRSMDDAIAAAERLSGHPDPRVTVGLAPHSVRAVDRAGLARAAAWDGVVHTHVSEQPAENAAALAEHGCSPTALLDDVGLLTSRFTAVHLTWPTDGDVDRLVRADATVCVCPSTELDLGDGFLPLDARRARLCLGSDSHATIDPWAELRALELHGRGLAGRRNVMAPVGERNGSGPALLAAATTAGSRALGGSGGAIRVGAPADLVAVDLRGPRAAGVPPLNAVVYGATPECVDAVWVAGEQRVAHGALVSGRDAIVARALPHLG